MFVSSVWVFTFAMAELSDSPHVPEPTTPCLNNYLPHFYMYVPVQVFYIAMAVFSVNTINQGFLLPNGQKDTY